MIAVALGGVQQPGPQADQSPGRDREDEVGVVAVGAHLLDHCRGGRRPAPSPGPSGPCGTSTTSDSNGSCGHAVALVEDDLGLADRQLVALAAHGLDEHRQVQQPAAGDVERLGPLDGSTRRATFFSSSRSAAVRGGGGR